MKDTTWSKSREKEIVVAQKLMNDTKNYDFMYGIEKDNKLIKKGLKSHVKASVVLDDLKTADTKKRNTVRLDAKRKFDAGKITKSSLRNFLDKNSIIPKYIVVYTEKKMKPAIQKRVNKILRGK